MSHAEEHFDYERFNATEATQLGSKASALFGISAMIGALGLVAAIVLGFMAGDGFRQFYFAYLLAYAFVVTLALGGLVFVLWQHISRAGWSITVRRIAELLGATFPILTVLAIPLVVSVLTGKPGQPSLYRWAQPLPAGGVVHHDEQGEAAHGQAVQSETSHDEADHGQAVDQVPIPAAYDGQVDDLMLQKRSWLNPPLFVIRVIGCLVLLSCVAAFYRRNSVRQDETGDVALTMRMQVATGPLILLCGLAVTLFSFDALMSLDPHWYSTMFGFYYMSGSFVAGFAIIIVIANVLQMGGFLKRSINQEHYHDLGKYLFGFVFFWGYIAFSQYMLLWYANLPETTAWLARRGVSAVPGAQNPFTWVAVLILFGHLLIPFGGLLSRHVKRKRPALLFWAIWLLVFHYLDMVWLVKPELSFINGVAAVSEYKLNLGLLDLFCLLGIGGVFVAAWVKMAGSAALRPLRDPRLGDALAFENQ